MPGGGERAGAAHGLRPWRPAPVSKLVENFLGRSFSFRGLIRQHDREHLGVDACRAWMNEAN